MAMLEYIYHIVRQKIGYFTGQARQRKMDLIPSAENGLVFVS